MITKTSMVVFIVTLAILIVSAIIGNILESNGTFGRLSQNMVSTVKVFYFTIFCILVLSLFPLILSYFISMQINIGNGDFLLIKWLKNNETGVVLGFWTFCIVGIFIAIPAIIRAGFFK